MIGTFLGCATPKEAFAPTQIAAQSSLYGKMTKQDAVSVIRSKVVRSFDNRMMTLYDISTDAVAGQMVSRVVNNGEEDDLRETIASIDESHDLALAGATGQQVEKMEAGGFEPPSE